MTASIASNSRTRHKRWVIAPLAPIDHLKRFPDIAPLVVQILYNRGITEPDEMAAFLQADRPPSTADLFRMAGINRTVDRIRRAIKAREPVAIYGDYDVDGVTATALLVQTPEFLFVKFIYNINSPANQSPPGHFRTTSMPFDSSYDHARTVGGKHLEDFLPDGFQIGSAMTINRAYADCNVDGPGCQYFYVAINHVGPPAPLNTTQTTSTITVTVPDSFEMTFDEAYGGNLSNFYTSPRIPSGHSTSRASPP